MDHVRFYPCHPYNYRAPTDALIVKNFLCREVVDGGRISLSTDREEVSLTLESTTRDDNGYWNCTAQVYDGVNIIGQSVERPIRLVVVGEFT